MRARSNPTIRGTIPALLTLAVCLHTGSAWSATYTVAADGDDGNPGTESEPWASVRKAANTAEAGDTVQVKAGTYYERVVFSNSGTAASNIIVKAFPGDTPVLNGRDNAQWNGFVNFAGVSHIRFEGFAITNCGVGQAIYIIHNGATPATEIVLTGLDIGGIADSPVQIRGNASHIVVEACTAHDCGASGIDASAFDGGRPSRITIRGNTVYNSTFAGIGSEVADDLLVESNTVYDCTIGIDVGSGKRNTIRNNSITDCGDGIALSSNFRSEVCDNTVSNANEAMYAYYWSANGEPHQSNKWYRNVVRNATWAFFEMDGKNTSADTGPTFGHEYYNNEFYGVGGNSYRAIFWYRGADDITFHNNTIYTKDNPGNEVFQLTEGATNASFMNNIVSLSGANGLFKINTGSDASIDYNAYHNRNGSVSAVGPNDIVADPLFENAGAADLHLQWPSPCIDAGTNLPAITDDLDGVARPLDGDTNGVPAWDMGAYEFVPESDGTSPVMPHGLSVIPPAHRE
ncbi:MAG: right-handed parallel beta-helix repeat-containing protein [Kiritimatiellae bacterium]|nr:right-handed parallel beta-helix repeat-containing protein [Kiritimatiellia bacterium]